MSTKYTDDIRKYANTLKKTIEEMKLSGAFIMYRTFHARGKNLHEEWNPLFNDQIIESIKNRTAVTATEVYVKDSRIGGSWVIGNKENKKLLSNKLYHKD